MPPQVRAYHSFNAVGNRCYALGGRTGQESLLVGGQILCIYDAAVNEWTSGYPVPSSFLTRSNHRAAVVAGNHIVICGGTGTRKSKMDDTHILRVAGNGQLTWRQLPPAAFHTGEQPSSSHAPCCAIESIWHMHLPTKSMLQLVFSVPGSTEDCWFSEEDCNVSAHSRNDFVAVWSSMVCYSFCVNQVCNLRKDKLQIIVDFHDLKVTQARRQVYDLVNRT